MYRLPIQPRGLSSIKFLALTFCIALTSACSADKEESMNDSNKSEAQITAEQLAKTTLAEQRNISKSELQVISSEAVDWPDASLGCPKPGMFYPQVITPGHKVSIKANDKTYQVHTAQTRALVCDKAGEQKMKIPDDKLINLNIESLTEKAKADLASKLGISESDVILQKITSVKWDDASLGCPQPNKQYTKSVVKGFVIRLEAKGKMYNYHSDEGDRIFPCPAISSK